MFYWGLDDFVAALSVIVSVGNIYFAYHITRVSQGAPRAWWFIVAGFTMLVVFRTIQLYFDTQSASDLIDDTEAMLSLTVNSLLLVGLAMLDRGFRRQAGARVPPPS